MWGSSKELTAIMRRSKKESKVTWDTVELVIPGGHYTVWSCKDGTPFTNLNSDPDDLYLEGSVTKNFGRICMIVLTK
jgi:hypothetical protein